MLENLGHAAKIKNLTAREQDEDLIAAVKNVKLRLLIIDEAHHFLSTKNRKNIDRQLGPAGDWIKIFHDKCNIGILFTGLPSIAQAIQADQQMKSRWPADLFLSNYTFGSEWIQLLDTLDDILPMEKPCGLAQKITAKKVHQITQGNFRSLKNFLAETVLHAASNERKSITNQDFSAALYSLGHTNPDLFSGEN